MRGDMLVAAVAASLLLLSSFPPSLRHIKGRKGYLPSLPLGAARAVQCKDKKRKSLPPPRAGSEESMVFGKGSVEAKRETGYAPKS